MSTLAMNRKDLRLVAKELDRLQRRNEVTIEIAIIREDLQARCSATAKLNALLDELEILAVHAVTQFAEQMSEQSDTYASLSDIQAKSLTKQRS